MTKKNIYIYTHGLNRNIHTHNERLTKIKNWKYKKMTIKPKAINQCAIII